MKSSWEIFQAKPADGKNAYLLFSPNDWHLSVIGSCFFWYAFDQRYSRSVFLHQLYGEPGFEMGEDWSIPWFLTEPIFLYTVVKPVVWGIGQSNNKSVVFSSGTLLINDIRAPYSYISSMANPDLKWEKTGQFDVGFEIGFWQLERYSKPNLQMGRTHTCCFHQT